MIAYHSSPWTHNNKFVIPEKWMEINKNLQILKDKHIVNHNIIYDINNIFTISKDYNIINFSSYPYNGINKIFESLNKNYTELIYFLDNNKINQNNEFDILKSILKKNQNISFILNDENYNYIILKKNN